MRRRILQSTVLVVTITGLVLGVPLGFTTWRLVEDFTRAGLLARLEQVVATLDGQPLTADLSAVALALPPQGRLVVDSPRGRKALGPDPGEGAVSEALPMAARGRVTLAVPGDQMRRTQRQVTAVVALLVVLSIATGATVATVTAGRLAGPLQDVAERAARLGAGDFRPVRR
ncbi:MAG: sensor histidine kinase, partial [Actinomycetota bacterium]|nr:sensor histidine kinase [Actinomycetota bacterium]